MAPNVQWNTAGQASSGTPRKRGLAPSPPSCSPCQGGLWRRCLSPFAALLAQAAPEEAVESGRRALDRWWEYPWYDPPNDGLRRIDVEDPWYLDWNWPNWRRGGGGAGWGTALEWFFWILAVLVLAAVVYLLVRTYLGAKGRRWWGGGVGDEAAAAADRQRIELLPFPVELALGDLLAEARRCYQEGRYGEAVKYLFSYELVQLDKHDLIRLARGKTNRRYLREVGPQPTIRPLLERTMIVFEDFFFGDYTIPRERFEACWSELPRLEAQLAGRTA